MNKETEYNDCPYSMNFTPRPLFTQVSWDLCIHTPSLAVLITRNERKDEERTLIETFVNLIVSCVRQVSSI